MEFILFSPSSQPQHNPDHDLLSSDLSNFLLSTLIISYRMIILKNNYLIMSLLFTGSYGEVKFCRVSVQWLSRVRLFVAPWTHTRLPRPTSTPRACSNLCTSNQWCHTTISSPVVPFSSCLPSFPASGSFPRSQFFASGGQSSGVSASASVLPINMQD